MANRASWLNRIVLLLLWLLITAGVSFYVARNAASSDDSGDVTAPLPPVGLDQRVTVSLAETTSVPVVSASGTVVRYNDTWMLEAPATSADVAYRLLDPPVAVRAQIDGGPSGFACPWVGLGQRGVPGPAPADDGDAPGTPDATPAAIVPGTALGFTVRPMAALVPIGEEPGSAPPAETPDASVPVSTAGVTLRCAIPEEVRVAAGMTGMMVLQMDKPTDTLALPVTAVVGAVDQGQVVVVHEDGTTERRTVQLGVSDIYNIAIIAGLAPDEMVLQNPTQADFAQAQEGS